MLPMVDPAFDDKASDTLVVDFGRRFWTGSSTLPHLHQNIGGTAPIRKGRRRAVCVRWSGSVGLAARFPPQLLHIGNGHPA